MKTTVLTMTALLGLGTLLACGTTDDDMGWTSDPAEAQSPDGTQPLVSLTDQQVVRAAVFGAWTQVGAGRAAGMAALVSALKTDLAARGIDTTSLDKIDETILEEPLATQSETTTGQSSSGLTVGTREQALNKASYAKYYGCPILAPSSTQATACDKLVKDVVTRVKANLAQNQQTVADSVKKLYADLGAEGQSFIQAWAIAAKQHGVDVAAVYAEAELRAQAKCDNTQNGLQVSYLLGVEQGQKIVLELRAWARSQVEACVVNTDQIVKAVEHKAQSKVKAYMKEHAVCQDADIGNLNQAYKAAEVKREEGIKAGIQQQVTVLRSELFNLRADVPCDGRCVPTEATKGGKCYLGLHSVQQSGGYEGWWVEHPEYKVCCRKQRASGKLRCIGTRKKDNATLWCREDTNADCLSCQDSYIYVGSPIVVDLDGDGLTLAEGQVRFDLLADGHPQAASWVGPREALLVLDRDGNGRVDSGAELFGDRTDCGGQTCYDGVTALAQYDARERGGNNDGLISARDAVFGRLRLWTDRNQDARTDDGELSTLADAGVRALNLDAVYDPRRLEGASVTARLQVLTDGGIREAHDLWFDLQIAPRNLATYFPGR